MFRFLAFWKRARPILKERIFGLTNAEGNHGEDVKEYYFYLDSTPTHSYMKQLYKYPQEAFPYGNLVETNQRRSRFEPEYELLDTGIFTENRYFDIEIEYAKASPEDILIKITARNRGPETADLHIVPTLWFRNTWAWWPDPPKPALRAASASGTSIVQASHAELGDLWLYLDGDAALLFTENETNNDRLFGGQNSGPFVKDGINDYIVGGRQSAINPAQEGTKAAAHCRAAVNAGSSVTVRLRLTKASPATLAAPFADFDGVMARRTDEADKFYRSLTPPSVSSDAALVMRQAFAGMLWSKQFYFLEADRWLVEHGVDPFSNKTYDSRNSDWSHMVNRSVISMPDKWEYPWYAAWDLAFHTVVLSAVDLDFAKQQLDMLMREFYIHPSGQIPAYEWNFG